MMPHTVTIVNFYKEGSNTLCQSTVLSGVYYQDSKGQNIKTYGNASADSIKCIVPFGVYNNRNYIDQLAFKTLDDIQRVKYFTLAKDDLLVKGAKVFSKEKKLSEISATESSKGKITTVDTYDVGKLQHWSIGGA